MFVLPAEIEERRHEEGYESANMSRPNLFNVLMKLSDSEIVLYFTWWRLSCMHGRAKLFKHSFFLLLLVS